MKKITNLTTSLFLLILIIACQETKVVEIELPYTDYTIIYGELPLEAAFKGITISRSLPLNVIYDISDAEITNAIAYLKLNGIDIIPLTYSRNGLYLPYNTIYPSSGDYYELYVDIDGKNFYSKSVVPQLPSAKKIELNGDILNIEVFGNTDESYGAIWAYVDENEIIIEQADDFYSIVDSKGDGQVVNIRTKSIPEDIRQEYQNGHLRVLLYAFGKNFGNYYNSKSLNTSIENALTQGGSPIFTNISGDQVIGAFTGSAKSLLTINTFN